MINSTYLKKLSEECIEIRKPIAKKTLFAVILLGVIAAASYIVLPMLDSNAAPTGTSLSFIFGLIALIFLLRYLKFNAKISDTVLNKCEQEIRKNLKDDESFETFDNDMLHPAFGEHSLNGNKVIVGRTFVLFQYLNANGPSFSILRGDNLGIFEVHYSSQGGVGTDIGADIKDKDNKFIRSIMTSRKDEFFKLLNAMENIKNYANGKEFVPTQASGNEDDEFVSELKKKVTNTDKKGFIKVGTIGIALGIFLCIAGNSSGEAFIYGGLALTVLSIAFIIGVNIKLKN